MARTRDPAVRAALIERAAQMLRDREPITIRSLVAGTGVSTMAVYTHFGGVDGLWRALRQEGFVRLGEAFARLHPTEDPVHDLAALVAAYAGNALARPDLYRLMFDASVELEDLPAADATLEYLVQAALRGRAAGRFRADVVPLDLAIRAWAVGHGVVSLVANGPLDGAALAHARPMLVGVCLEAGDEPERARESVAAGWGEGSAP